jgi:DUF4097 and DUF4098 domain-containing protein YvlB
MPGNSEFTSPNGGVKPPLPETRAEEEMKSYRSLGLMPAVLLFLSIASPGVADSRIEKDLALQPGGQFTLESEVGSVTLTGTSRPDAHIVITSEQGDLNGELEFTFTSGSGWARVTARRKHESFWSHGDSVRFEIEVPTHTRTEVHTGGGAISLSGLQGDSDVKTSGGPISVDGLNGSLEAYTSGGPIHVREVTGDVHAGTSGGPIEAEEVDGSLVAHTSGGPVHIDRVSGRVDARTSGGSIHATYGRGNIHGGVLETSGGSIEVAVDRSANLNLDASTSGGSVSSELPVKSSGAPSHSSLRGPIGSGGEELRLHTSGGSIRIRAL